MDKTYQVSNIIHKKIKKTVFFLEIISYNGNSCLLYTSLLRIQKYDKTFSKGQKRLAAYVLKNYDKAVFLTASKMGKEVGVSESTTVRFATQLGYKGFPEFHRALEELVRNKLNSIQRMKVDVYKRQEGFCLRTHQKCE